MVKYCVVFMIYASCTVSKMLQDRASTLHECSHAKREIENLFSLKKIKLSDILHIVHSIYSRIHVLAARPVSNIGTLLNHMESQYCTTTLHYTTLYYTTLQFISTINYPNNFVYFLICIFRFFNWIKNK